MKLPKKLKDLIFEEITAFGGVLIYISTIIISLFLKNFILFIELLSGLSFLYISAIIIRSIYFKERPKKRSYHTFIGKIDASSFPSLHSARALFFSLIIKSIFPNNQIFYFLLFITLLVGYSRIYLKKHYWFDVIGGYILGFIIYLLVNFIF